MPLAVSQNAELMDAWRKTLNDEIIRSPFPPIDPPTEPLISRTIRALREHAESHPGRAAVIDAFDQERRLSYRQVHDQALSVAAFLLSRGFGNGDRAAAVLPNCVEFPVIHLGVWAAGGIFVGCSPALRHYETVYQLLDSASSVVFTNEALLESVIAAAKECPEVKTIICIRSTTSPLPEGVLDFHNGLECKPLEEPVARDYRFTSLIFFFRHFIDEVFPALHVNKVDWYQEHQIISTGCFHVFGFGLLNLSLLTGTTAILMSRLDEVVYAKMIAQFKPRCLSVSPPIFAYFAKDPVGRAASLESVQFGSANGYGSTETGGTHYPLLLKEGASASCGVMVSGYEQKIIDPTTRKSCKQGEWGEICLKGPGVLAGYLNQPEATRDLFDAEGWLHSGDIGYIDSLGCLYIVDRVKELIKVNYGNQTLQVPPAELEGVLLFSPFIRDAAIVGVPHENGGELVSAFVVRADEELTGEEVEQVIADSLAPFKRITGGVVFVDAIPRSAAGKILRRELRDKS